MEPFAIGDKPMEKETREIQQDPEEIEVLDKGLVDEADIRGLCCWGIITIIRF
jgi:hypothetical protein